jgi:sortase A
MMVMMFARARTASGRRRSVPVVVALAGLLLLSACGSANEPTAAAAVSTVPATTAPSTPSTPTTTGPATTTSTTTTTTVVPSTTTEPSPTTTSTTTSTTTTSAPPETIALEHGNDEAAGPIAPPTDSYAQEPVIEMGSLRIPKLGVDMTMYEGIRLTTLDYGPGHWPGSAEPGEDGNVVVGGHRTSKHRVFRNVDQLVQGDEIIFEDDDGTHVYLVDSVEIVEPTAIWIVDPTETPRATLFACHPPGSTAQRIVVFADLVEE